MSLALQLVLEWVHALEFLSEISLGSVSVKLLALQLVLEWVLALEVPSEMQWGYGLVIL